MSRGATFFVTNPLYYGAQLPLREAANASATLKDTQSAQATSLHPTPATDHWQPAQEISPSSWTINQQTSSHLLASGNVTTCEAPPVTGSQNYMAVPTGVTHPLPHAMLQHPGPITGWQLADIPPRMDNVPHLQSLNSESAPGGEVPSQPTSTGGKPYIPPPQKPVPANDSLFSLRQLYRKASDAALSFFTRSRSTTHEVASPNVTLLTPEQADEHDIALTMFEYPSKLEEVQLIEKHTTEEEEPCITALQPQIEPAISDSRTKHPIPADTKFERDVLYPMRKAAEKSHCTGNTEHTKALRDLGLQEETQKIREATTFDHPSQSENELLVEQEAIMPVSPLVESPTHGEEHQDVLDINTINTDPSKPESNEILCTFIDVVDTAAIADYNAIHMPEEPLQAEEGENQCTFIDGDDEPPLTTEEIDKIMPKEDREMYKAVFTCLTTSEDKQCCSCKSCFNCCCYSVSCKNPTNLCKNGGTELKSILTPALQKGVQNGWKIFTEIAFPTIRPFFRDLIAISEFLLGLLGLILSGISFHLGNNAGYNIAHITFAGIATVLGFIDTFTSLTYSAALKKAWSERKTRECCPHPTADNIEQDQPKDDPATAVNQGQKQTNRNTKQNGKDTATSKETSIVHIQNRNEPDWLKKGWDLGRLIVAEMIFYPLLLCDLVEFIVDKGYKFEADNASDIVGFFLVIHSFVSQVFYVYVLRLVILIATIIHIHKKRVLSPDTKQKIARLEKHMAHKEDTTEEDESLSHAVATDGIKFQSYFAFHVAAQMAAQILMIVAISMTLHKENENKTLDDSIHISNELWFMMVAGFIFPYLGILSFFIATFYWTYEHPSGICINVLSILETPGIGHVLMFDEDTKDVWSKVIEITKNLNKSQLKEDFLNLRNQPFTNKLFYPFKSPVLVIVCLVYSFSQFAFVLTAILAIRSGDPGTIFFYILSIVVGIIANIYVLAVAALWTTIIVGILILIAIIIMLIVLACMLLSCGSSKSSQRTRVY